MFSMFKTNARKEREEAKNKLGRTLKSLREKKAAIIKALPEELKKILESEDTGIRLFTTSLRDIGGNPENTKLFNDLAFGSSSEGDLALQHMLREPLREIIEQEKQVRNDALSTMGEAAKDMDSKVEGDLSMSGCNKRVKDVVERYTTLKTLAQFDLKRQTAEAFDKANAVVAIQLESISSGYMDHGSGRIHSTIILTGTPVVLDLESSP